MGDYDLTEMHLHLPKDQNEPKVYNNKKEADDEDISLSKHATELFIIE